MEYIEKLFHILNTTLLLQSPVLSGNMRSGIKLHKFSKDEITIVIQAPFYDMKLWKKTGAIKLTGAVVDGKSSYAYWVNKEGAFGTQNKSMRWANRACLDAVSIVANEIGATVVNELPL